MKHTPGEEENRIRDDLPDLFHMMEQVAAPLFVKVGKVGEGGLVREAREPFTFEEYAGDMTLRYTLTWRPEDNAETVTIIVTREMITRGRARSLPRVNATV
jgi:hypothetical protein